jgi:hypothetical protein
MAMAQVQEASGLVSHWRNWVSSDYRYSLTKSLTFTSLEATTGTESQRRQLAIVTAWQT